MKGVTLWSYRVGHWRTAQGAQLANADATERPAVAAQLHPSHGAEHASYLGRQRRQAVEVPLLNALCRHRGSSQKLHINN